MSNSKIRKVSFNSLIKREWRSGKETPFYQISEVIRYILKLGKLEKQFDMKEDKFCLIQSAVFEKDNSNNTIITGIFKSARNKFSPNLLDKKTGDERKSPKKLTEGDVEKTHFAIKIVEDEVFITLEINGNGVTINQIVEYFTLFSRKYFKSKNLKHSFTLKYLKLGRTDFLQQIKSMQRVRSAKVYFDKSLLGSSCLAFSDRTTSLQREIELTVKAEKSDDISETAIDFWNSFSNNKNKSISKVRIEGKDENGTEVALDTSFMEMIDSINVSLNPTTGEVETSEMTTALKAFLKKLK